MKDIIVSIINAMRGCFLKKEFNIEESINIKDLDYISKSNDKENIRRDISRLAKDFNKAKNEAELKFSING